MKSLARAAGAAAVVVLLAACDLPFGLGLPTIQALNRGAGDSLDAANSFRVAGFYTESATAWKMDLEMVKPGSEHVLLSSQDVNLEAIVTAGRSYFRGRQFLVSHMGSDPYSQSLVQAAGDNWWTGLPATAPATLTDFTKGSSLRSTFLGTAVTSRTDHVSVGGLPAIELSGPRADVFLSAAPPYRVLRIRMKKGALVDGVSAADFMYSDFGRDFAIAAPAGALNFADLSTLPPVYTVLSVDASGCAFPCAVSASLKNLGGKSPARAPSTVKFTMTDPQTSTVLGDCQVTVQPDVGHSATTTVSCTIAGVNGADHNAAVVTATVDNSGVG